MKNFSLKLQKIDILLIFQFKLINLKNIIKLVGIKFLIKQNSYRLQKLVYITYTAHYIYFFTFLLIFSFFVHG